MQVNNNMTVLGTLDCQALGDGLKNGIDGIVTERLETALRLLSERAQKDRTELLEKLAVLTDKYNNMVEKYNTAAATVNAMSERLAAVEANYDPTVIK